MATNAFIAQTSIKQRLDRGYPGMIATAVPWHIGHGIHTSLQSVTVTPVAANAAVYSLTITQQGEAVVYSYTADGDATAAEIVDGLVAAVNAGSQSVTAVDNNTTLSLVADAYTSEYAFSVATSASAGSLTASTVTSQNAAFPDGHLAIFDSSVSSDPMAVRLPNASADITTVTSVAGIALADHFASVRTSNATLAPKMLSFMRKGQIYVAVEEAVTANSPVYVRYAAGGNGLGAFGAGAGSSERALLNGAVYRSAAASGAVAVVEINIIGG